MSELYFYANTVESTDKAAIIGAKATPKDIDSKKLLVSLEVDVKQSPTHIYIGTPYGKPNDKYLCFQSCECKGHCECPNARSMFIWPIPRDETGEITRCLDVGDGIDLKDYIQMSKLDFGKKRLEMQITFQKLGKAGSAKFVYGCSSMTNKLTHLDLMVHLLDPTLSTRAGPTVIPLSPPRNCSLYFHGPKNCIPEHPLMSLHPRHRKEAETIGEVTELRYEISLQARQINNLNVRVSEMEREMERWKGDVTGDQGVVDQGSAEEDGDFTTHPTAPASTKSPAPALPAGAGGAFGAPLVSASPAPHAPQTPAGSTVVRAGFTPSRTSVSSCKRPCSEGQSDSLGEPPREKQRKFDDESLVRYLYGEPDEAELLLSSQIPHIPSDCDVLVNCPNRDQEGRACSFRGTPAELSEHVCFCRSDRRLKFNITDIVGALEIVKKLRGTSYTFSDHGNRVLGFIAQELRKIVPEAVMGDEETEFLTVDYKQLLPIVVRAMQEHLMQYDADLAETRALHENAEEAHAASFAALCEEFREAKEEADSMREEFRTAKEVTDSTLASMSAAHQKEVMRSRERMRNVSDRLLALIRAVAAREEDTREAERKLEEGEKGTVATPTPMVAPVPDGTPSVSTPTPLVAPVPSAPDADVEADAEETRAVASPVPSAGRVGAEEESAISATYDAAAAARAGSKRQLLLLDNVKSKSAGQMGGAKAKDGQNDSEDESCNLPDSPDCPSDSSNLCFDGPSPATKRNAEEVAAAKCKAEVEAAEKEAEAKRKAEEDAEAKRKAEEDAEAKRKAEEEAEAKRKAESAVLTIALSALAEERDRLKAELDTRSEELASLAEKHREELQSRGEELDAARAQAGSFLRQLHHAQDLNRKFSERLRELGETTLPEVKPHQCAKHPAPGAPYPPLCPPPAADSCEGAVRPPSEPIEAGEGYTVQGREVSASETRIGLPKREQIAYPVYGAPFPCSGKYRYEWKLLGGPEWGMFGAAQPSTVEPTNSICSTLSGFFLRWCRGRVGLWAGPPFHYRDAPVEFPARIARGSRVEVVVDMDARTVAFVLDGHDLGVLYRDVPMSVWEPLAPCAMVYTPGHKLVFQPSLGAQVDAKAAGEAVALDVTKEDAAAANEAEDTAATTPPRVEEDEAMAAGGAYNQEATSPSRVKEGQAAVAGDAVETRPPNTKGKEAAAAPRAEENVDRNATIKPRLVERVYQTLSERYLQGHALDCEEFWKTKKFLITMPYSKVLLDDVIGQVGQIKRLFLDVELLRGPNSNGDDMLQLVMQRPQKDIISDFSEAIALIDESYRSVLHRQRDKLGNEGPGHEINLMCGYTPIFAHFVAFLGSEERQKWEKRNGIEGVENDILFAYRRVQELSARSYESIVAAIPEGISASEFLELPMCRLFQPHRVKWDSALDHPTQLVSTIRSFQTYSHRCLLHSSERGVTFNNRILAFLQLVELFGVDLPPSRRLKSVHMYWISQILSAVENGTLTFADVGGYMKARVGNGADDPIPSEKRTELWIALGLEDEPVWDDGLSLSRAVDSFVVPFLRERWGQEATLKQISSVRADIAFHGNKLRTGDVAAALSVAFDGSSADSQFGFFALNGKLSPEMSFHVANERAAVYPVTLEAATWSPELISALLEGILGHLWSKLLSIEELKGDEARLLLGELPCLRSSLENISLEHNDNGSANAFKVLLNHPRFEAIVTESSRRNLRLVISALWEGGWKWTHTDPHKYAANNTLRHDMLFYGCNLFELTLEPRKEGINSQVEEEKRVCKEAIDHLVEEAGYMLHRRPDTRMALLRWVVHPSFAAVVAEIEDAAKKESLFRELTHLAVFMYTPTLPEGEAFLPLCRKLHAILQLEEDGPRPGELRLGSLLLDYFDSKGWLPCPGIAGLGGSLHVAVHFGSPEKTAAHVWDMLKRLFRPPMPSEGEARQQEFRALCKQWAPVFFKQCGHMGAEWTKKNAQIGSPATLLGQLTPALSEASPEVLLLQDTLLESMAPSDGEEGLSDEEKKLMQQTTVMQHYMQGCATRPGDAGIEGLLCCFRLSEALGMSYPPVNQSILQGLIDCGAKRALLLALAGKAPPRVEKAFATPPLSPRVIEELAHHAARRGNAFALDALLEHYPSSVCLPDPTATEATERLSTLRSACRDEAEAALESLSLRKSAGVSTWNGLEEVLARLASGST